MAETNEPFPHPEAMDAVRHFAQNVTAPLLHSADGGFPMPIGTATFFKVADRLFLISAAHNFDEADLSGFAVPENRAKGKFVRLSGQLCWPKPQHRGLIDVAALALAPECAEAISAAGWQAIGLENIRQASPQGVFVLCGYPTQRTRQQGETLYCTMITAFTERMSEPPKGVSFQAEPDPIVDLFFHYDATANDTAGSEVHTPRLHGASGANVWEYIEPATGELWTAAKAVKAVAVQSSEVEYECFRAKTWGAVLSAIRTAYPELANAINTKFDGNVPEGTIATQ